MNPPPGPADVIERRTHEDRPARLMIFIIPGDTIVLRHVVAA